MTISDALDHLSDRRSLYSPLTKEARDHLLKHLVGGDSPHWYWEGGLMKSKSSNRLLARSSHPRPNTYWRR